MTLDPLREEADIIYRPEPRPSELEQLREELEEPADEIADSTTWVQRCRQTRLEALRTKETHG